MTSYVNTLKINRVAKSKDLIGKKVKIKGSDHIHVVSGRTPNGYVILDNKMKQDVEVLVEVVECY